MNEIPTYDHSKPEVEDADKPSFYHRAAKIAFWAPLLAGIFLKSLEYSLHDSKGAWVIMAEFAILGVAVLICLTSIVLGLIALFGISTYGASGILWRSLRGIAISVALMCYLGANVLHAYVVAKNRVAMEAANQAAKEIREESKNEVATNGTMTNGQAKLEKMKTELDKASKQMTGDEALMVKAMSAYMEKAQAYLKNYEASADAVKMPSALNMKDVERKEQLQSRKEAVNKFMDANEKLMGFINRGESAFRVELVRLNASASATDISLKLYRQSTAERNFISMKVRMTDQRIGTAMLGMLNVLESSWGKWKYNTETKKVLFQDNAALESYLGFYKDLTTAASEQAQLQAQLVKLPDTVSAK